MNEEDPLRTYSLWAKQADIPEENEPIDYATKPNGTIQKENMDDRRRTAGREEVGYEIKHRQAPKSVPRRTRILPSSEDSDAILYAEEGTQTALGDTPPSSQYKGLDDEYASTARKLARATLAEKGRVEAKQQGRVEEKHVMKAAMSKRGAGPPVVSPEVKAAQEAAKAKEKDTDLAKQSWSKRALARTKDILSITAKEPSTLAFEDYRNKEFKRAGVKAGDNAAAKLHVSSQKLPPEAPKVQSKEPPPITKNVTDANTTANKSVGRFNTGRTKTTTGSYARGNSSSAHSLASSGSKGSSVALGSGSARVSYQESASGSGGAGSERGGGSAPAGPPRLMHSQTDGTSRGPNAGMAGHGNAGRSTTRLSEKQKAAAVDERW